ncbi:MAG: hypothetical protein LLG06_09445 [Desulfobacteraceae bacterium]|nr:hypothetical protein [Desulfobacteraceae bacterium]
MTRSLRNRILIRAALICIAAFTWTPPVWADDEKPAASAEIKPAATVSVDVLSQYIFRGLGLSKQSAVLQPSATAGYAGFAVSIWGNFDTAQHSSNPLLPVRSGSKWNETDFTFSYSRELFKDFSATVGNIYYSLSGPFLYDLDELYLGFSYNFPWLTAAFAAYREISHSPGWWFQFDLTKSIPLPFHEGMSLDLGASLGYQILDAEDNLLNLDSMQFGTYSEFHSATLSAGLKVPVHKYLTITPKIGVALPLTGASSDFIKANSFDCDSTHVFGGINLSASF